MPNVSPSAPATNVAPLAGSVDRNVICVYRSFASAQSLPSRGAWIEILLGFAGTVSQVSLPSRGAWIEINVQAWHSSPVAVAPLAGSVDRNDKNCKQNAHLSAVAPLAGSVDRNPALHVRPKSGAQSRSPRGERG